MFHRFAERYLCAVHRMKRHNISVALECRSTTLRGTYSNYGVLRLDPLAFMLEGTTCSGDCYRDFAADRAIPAEAMKAFRLFLDGRESKSDWSRQNPALNKELQNFAYGVFYAVRQSFQDSRYYLDLVSELDGKTKMKQLITNPKAKVLPKKPRGLSLQELYEQERARMGAPQEYNNQLW